MGSITICRTVTGTAIGTSFTALSAVLASTVSSSFVVPTGVSAIKHVSVAMATDDVTESATVCRLSGNALRDSGEQFVNGPSMNTIGTSTGAFNGTVGTDVDFAVTPGNSVEVAMGATASITGDASVVLTFA